ncbi:hypothetical protein [Longimicrobium sp.]|nr:hypothetical protein [Longimicrobium sp.]HEX6038704.1 hypothetical protein [Longimicrobium sp.]
MHPDADEVHPVRLQQNWSVQPYHAFTQQQYMAGGGSVDGGM